MCRIESHPAVALGVGFACLGNTFVLFCCCEAWPLLSMKSLGSTGYTPVLVISLVLHAEERLWERLW